MTRGLSVITPPDYTAFAAVPLTDLKKHLRITWDTEDAMLQTYLNSAIEDVEDTCRRAIAEQTWTLTLAAFPDCDGPIRIPKPPLQTVDEIRYVAADGTVTILANTEYVTDPSTLPGTVVLKYGKHWPVTRSQQRAVEVDFTCGFENAATVPNKVKAATLLYAADLYRNREAQLVGGGGLTVQDNPTAMRLLSKFLFREF